jgi:hypothetical protein
MVVADGGLVGDYGESIRALGRPFQGHGYANTAKQDLMGVYRELAAVKVPMRRPALLTGMASAIASYRPCTDIGTGARIVRPVPANKLSTDER